MQMENIQDVQKYWETFPLGSREIQARMGTQEYFNKQDELRWQDNEKYATEFYLLPELHQQGPKKILDAGCGPGFFTRFYARMGHTVTAVDLTQAAVELNRKSLELFSLQATVQQMNLEQLNLASNTFDFIVCNGVIHHTPNTEQALAELYRVLRPGGKLSLQIYYRNILLQYPCWFLTRLLFRLCFGQIKERKNFALAQSPEEFVKSYDGDGTPIAKLYSKEEAIQLCHQFKVLKIEPHYFPMRFFRLVHWLPRPIQNFLHRRCDRWFGTLIYLLLEKES